MNSTIPLSVPYFNGRELEYVSECVKTGWVSSAGPFVNRFEEMIRVKTGGAHAVACQSGTAALHISLLLCDVKPNDEVLIPTLTFIAPVNTIRYVNAHPVFMDCDEYLNLDPEKIKKFCETQCRFENGFLINNKTNRRVSALMVVHVFGHPVNLAGILPVAKKYNLKVIEDATEALGSEYISGPLKGRQAGTIGDLGCYSFNGNKIITTGGGGMLVTPNAELAKKARYLTTQAKDDEEKFIHNEVGYNYRMTNLQAALGCAQMEQLDVFIQTKRDHFQKYQDALSDIPGLNLIAEPPYAFSNYWYYTLQIDPKLYGLNLGQLKKNLDSHQIQTRPIWELNHRQKPFASCEAYEISEAILQHERCLNIPCSSNLSKAEIESVVKVIRDKK